MLSTAVTNVCDVTQIILTCDIIKCTLQSAAFYNLNIWSDITNRRMQMQMGHRYLVKEIWNIGDSGLDGRIVVKYVARETGGWSGQDSAVLFSVFANQNNHSWFIYWIGRSGTSENETPNIIRL